MNIKPLLVAGIATMLSGCMSYGNLEGRYDPEAFGEANRQSYAAMVENPEPVYDEDMQGNAEKAAEAVERYREDRVKEPERVTSTTTPGGR